MNLPLDIPRKPKPGYEVSMAPWDPTQHLLSLRSVSVPLAMRPERFDIHLLDFRMTESEIAQVCGRCRAGPKNSLGPLSLVRVCFNFEGACAMNASYPQRSSAFQGRQKQQRDQEAMMVEVKE